ncbi:stomatin-like protein 1 isoform X4 [Rhipicephalus microplus]|uniref:stomatin-like protein 1 isoform X4 n=1 Tax=Rhipicephalus microplus TaxID=6941 RepID=UPI003F6A644C
MRVDIAGGLVEVTMNDFSPYRDSYDTPDFVFDYTSAFDYSSIHHMTALKKPEKYKTIFNYKRRQVVVDLSDCEPEPWQSTIIRTIVTFFCYLFLVFTFPVTCWVCIKRVPSLERIAVFRLGKLQPVQGPGLVLVFPVIDSYMKVDLKPKVFEVPAREVLTGDGAIVEVGAELHWQVVHSVRYVTRVKEVDATVGALCQQCLASLLGCSDQDDLDRRREAIEATLLTKLNETILPWGLEVIKVTLKVARVVKTAEPSNPLTPVMSAIKSALGFPSEHAKTQTSMPPRPGQLQLFLCVLYSGVWPVAPVGSRPTTEWHLHGFRTTFMRCPARRNKRDGASVLQSIHCSWRRARNPPANPRGLHEDHHEKGRASVAHQPRRAWQ